MSSSTAGQPPDCTDKTVIVTVANSGLGFEVTKVFVDNGATVIMAYRSADRGTRAAAEVQQSVEHAESRMDVLRCGLASLQSIDSFASAVAAEYHPIDALCNNAGVVTIPPQETDDGFEKQLGVNHLGHFALAGRLLDRLLRSDGESRIVTHLSGAHTAGEVDFDDLLRTSPAVSTTDRVDC